MKHSIYRSVIVITAVAMLMINLFALINTLDIARYHVWENIYDGGLRAESDWLNKTLILSWIANSIALIKVIDYRRAWHQGKALITIGIAIATNLLLWIANNIAMNSVKLDRPDSLSDWQLIAEDTCISNILLLVILGLIITVAKLIVKGDNNEAKEYNNRESENADRRPASRYVVICTCFMLSIIFAMDMISAICSPEQYGIGDGAYLKRSIATVVIYSITNIIYLLTTAYVAWQAKGKHNILLIILVTVYIGFAVVIL